MEPSFQAQSGSAICFFNAGGTISANLSELLGTFTKLGLNWPGRLTGVGCRTRVPRQIGNVPNQMRRPGLAGTGVFMAPVIILLFFAQKAFVEGSR